MLFTRGMAIRPRDRIKPLEELDRARTALKEAGFAFDSLTLGPDPPDCVAMLDGGRTGIEVTRLADQEALNETAKLKRAKVRHSFYFSWDKPSFLARVQKLIDDKAVKPFRGGPYVRKVLVIWTDEAVLSRGTVEHFLEGHQFSCSAFADVVLGLDYHPDYQFVAFRLALGPTVT
jgi:hypothetical protein